MRSTRLQFAVCIDNQGTPASLEIGKVYRILRTEKIEREMGLLRVVDESGEDYLYKADQFVDVKLPRAAREAVLKAR